MAEASNSIQPEWSVFSKRKKRLIIFLASWGGFFSPVSAAIYFPAIQTLAHDFDKSTSLINLTITSYMILQGLAPTFFGVLAEHVGKRPVYLITFTIYIGANIGLALQDNYAALLALRCLQSTGSSATIALAIGTAGDVARGSERGTYVGWTSGGFLIGPAIGPVIGGLLAGSLSWRAIFWFLTIMAVVYLAVYATLCPETARSVVGNGSITPPPFNRTLLEVLSASKAEKAAKAASRDLERNEQRQNTAKPILSREDLTNSEEKEALGEREPANQSGHETSDPEKDEALAMAASKDARKTPPSDEGKKGPAMPSTRRKFRFPNPLESLILLKEVDIAIILFYNALLFGAPYQMMASTVTIFKELYGYDDTTIGLCYMPFGIATMIGSVVGGRISDWNLKRIARAGNFEIDRQSDSPESQAVPWEKARMQVAAPFALAGGCFFIGYGWSVNWHTPVAVPLVLQFFIGLSANTGANAFSVMLVDRYPSKSATASAANNFTRCLFGAGATAVIEPMLKAMGRGPCFFFVGGVLLLFSPLMLVLVKHGPRWRMERLSRL